jgi:hypothetical protein
MNEVLWNKILDFDFDNPISEYGFSTRLANENFWTIQFTTQAILEYKKFMYLAATSEYMISPSKIIDIVWHQHLIFTQSYQDFCNILGKHIQHIPSTHNKEDFLKFRQAKERTIKFYERDFGQQPENIWGFESMFESLKLEKAKFKLQTFIIFGILTLVCLTMPAYFILKSTFIHINNPDFVIGLITVSVLTLLTLEFYNRVKLKNILLELELSSFVYHLQPYELVYLKTKKISNVINGTINELIENGTIKINSNNTIELVKSNDDYNHSQHQIVSVLAETGTTYYPNLLRKLTTKPIFWNIANSMDAFTKYFYNSEKFGNIFYVNFVGLTLLFLLSFTRIVIGVSRDKPVLEIIIATIVIFIIALIFLNRLTKQISTTTIPEFYRNEILPKIEYRKNWQWIYFMVGTAVLTSSFAPIVRYINKNSGNSGNSCGTSCGSSCGNSCGGCGGD